MRIKLHLTLLIGGLFMFFFGFALWYEWEILGIGVFLYVLGIVASSIGIVEIASDTLNFLEGRE